MLWVLHSKIYSFLCYHHWIYNVFDIHYFLNVTDYQISATGIIFIFISALNCLLLFVKRIFSKIYGLWKWGEQPFILIHEELEMGTCWPLKRIKIGQALLTISYFLQTKEKNLTNIKIDDSKISEISRPRRTFTSFVSLSQPPR